MGHVHPASQVTHAEGVNLFTLSPNSLCSSFLSMKLWPIVVELACHCIPVWRSWGFEGGLPKAQPDPMLHPRQLSLAAGQGGVLFFEVPHILVMPVSWLHTESDHLKSIRQHRKQFWYLPFVVYLVIERNNAGREGGGKQCIITCHNAPIMTRIMYTFPKDI